MKTLDFHDAPKAVRCDDLFAAIAALWEHRPERLADVTEQVRTIHDKLIEWGWGTVDRDELDHATIQYSHACSVHECCQWLPFDVMPNWEDDLRSVLLAHEANRKDHPIRED